MYQTLDSVQAKEITGTPNKLLGDLEKFLEPNPSETYTNRHLEAGRHRPLVTTHNGQRTTQTLTDK